MCFIKFNLSSIIILIITFGCSLKPHDISNIKDQTYISKSNISLNPKNLPEKIYIFYSDSEPKNFIDGFTHNYFYTQNETKYSPELFFVNLVNQLNPCKEKIKVTRKSYFVFYLKDKKDFNFNINCITGIKENSGLVIDLSQSEVNIPKNFYYLKIKRNKIIRATLVHARKEGSLRSIIIDDENTKDGKLVEKIWKDLGGNTASQASLKNQSKSQELISDLLLLDQSSIRGRKLSREISSNLKYESRSRQDVDSFILSTSLENARSLRPALNYNFINLVPIYLIPNWDSKASLLDNDADLEGSFVVDMPLMLNAKIDPDNLGKIKKSRGFAAGYDTFELILLLNSQQKIKYLGMMGMISNSGKVMELKPLIAKVQKEEIKYIYTN